METRKFIDTSNRVRGEIVCTHRLATYPRWYSPIVKIIIAGSMLTLIALFLGGCAGKMPYRDTFMNRAQAFDKAHEGQEFTTEYMECYTIYFLQIFDECVPLVVDDIEQDDPAQNPYWYCCDDALDAMEDCMEETS
jgi:hypothetical protein